MGQKLIVGLINHGIRTDRTAFNIDNDSFPVLLNAYQWRGRVKRKRGTEFVTRLSRLFNSDKKIYSPFPTIALVSGAANILTGFNLEPNGNIIPGSVLIVDTNTGITYQDPVMDGTLVGIPPGLGTINYATGAITIVGGGTDNIKAQFAYYPDLPVMGLKEFVQNANESPKTVAFDTTYAYAVPNISPYQAYSVSFYKNPSIDGTILPGYVPKTDVTPLHWNGADYQQFYTVNYQGSLWATNGVAVPFFSPKLSMQFASSTDITSATWVNATTVNFVIPGSPLVVGDFVFANEFTGTAGNSLNFQSGYVTVVNSGTSTFTVVFPFAVIANTGLIPGILQYLTNSSDPSKDCLRWYDGDPTNATPASPSGPLGWVNFCPPISQSNFSIENLPAAQYYLISSRIVFPFKDRILFFGPVVQASSGVQVYLQDTVIYSQNGTAYYTCSFDGSSVTAITSPKTTFHPILTPRMQTATAPAYFADSTGFGGNISAGLQQAITTVNSNEDVLIVGFSNKQTRLVSTGTDLVPFLFYVINSELGSASTFSSVNLDRGVIAIGTHGICQSAQNETQRIDLEIPDQIFEFNLNNNGFERVTSQRDFQSEWIYFTYCSNSSSYTFPNQTLLYNYRDQSWGIFNENYTTYGTFRRQVGTKVWNQLTDFTWEEWQEPWNSGYSTTLQPIPVAGNQQGFVVIRVSDTTGEDKSLYIQSFSGNTITSPNCCLNTGDFIKIENCIGTISTFVNGKVFQVLSAPNQNSFIIGGPPISGTYFGGGEITRFYRPTIKTRQFPVAWEAARKTRLGSQQYLFTGTDNAQITLQIFLSMDSANPYNFGPVTPAVDVENDALVYSDILYTCPESTNLGLTPANINLQMVTGTSQSQIWHRMNTSLLGDTVQIGFTLSDAQMADPTSINQFAEIELHGFILDITPSQLLA